MFSRWFGDAYRLLVQCTGKEDNPHDTKLYFYQDTKEEEEKKKKKKREKKKKGVTLNIMNCEWRT